MPDTGPEREAVLLALERLLAWPDLARSPQLTSFLQYIVQRTLYGQEQSIKAYSIAVDVFGRPAGFDPQLDPIVRVQARRLRALLKQYYATDGVAEPVQIMLPTGRYVPEFVWSRLPNSPPLIVSAPSEPLKTSRRLPPLWASLPIALALLASVAFGINRWSQDDAPVSGALQPPSVTIVEFANLANANSNPPIVSGLAIELVTDLEQFENIEVRYGGASADASHPGADFTLSGVVRGDGNAFQYSALLTETATETVVWNRTISVPTADARQGSILDELSRRFSMTLGSFRGPVHAKANKLALSEQRGTVPASIYYCRSLFYAFRQLAATPVAEAAKRCLGNLPEAERNSGIALALSAVLAAETVPMTAQPSEREQVYQQALADANRAIQAAPVSSFVWEQRAFVQRVMGKFAEALSDYGSALQLNPANTDALAANGSLLVVSGAAEQARPMIKDALEGAPNPPPWYFGGPSVLALLDNDMPRAIDLARRYAQSQRELGPVLGLIAGKRAGDAAMVNLYLPQVMEMPRFRRQGILPRLRERISDPKVIGMIEAGLLAAGLPKDALEQPF